MSTGNKDIVIIMSRVSVNKSIVGRIGEHDSVFVNASSFYLFRRLHAQYIRTCTCDTAAKYYYDVVVAVSRNKAERA